MWDRSRRRSTAGTTSTLGRAAWPALVLSVALAAASMAGRASAQSPPEEQEAGESPAASEDVEAVAEPEGAEPDVRAELEPPEPEGAPSLTWPDGFSRYDWPHGIATALAVGGGIAFFLAGAPYDANWAGRNELDGPVRDAVTLGSRTDRETVSTVSDGIFFAMLAFPVVVDALLVAGLLHGSSDVALQTGLISSEVLAFGLLASMLTTRGVGRERPFVQSCQVDPEYAAGCFGDGDARNTSFVSGHGLMTFAVAGSICATHTVFRLYGSVAADATACGTAIALAGAVSVMRMNADRHWLTDTVAGSALGLLIGWLTPALLHYHPWARVRVVPAAPGAQAGLGLQGAW